MNTNINQNRLQKLNQLQTVRETIIETPKESKSWDKEKIKILLQTNNKAVGKALVALLNLQTSEEQRYSDTHIYNNVGFNKCDAKILTSMATWYKRTGMLTPKQTLVARKKVLKYAGQLAKIANKEI